MAISFVARAAVIAATGVLTVPLLASPAMASAPHPSGPAVVVSGLNNPRQLSLVDGDVLLVAEAGKGGTIATFDDPEGGGLTGVGYTGSVSAVLGPQSAHNQHPHRIVTGLLSAAALNASPDGPAGGGATGPDGVSARSLNDIAIIETTARLLTPPPVLPAAAKSRDGHLLRATPYGPVKPFADITGFEIAKDPDHKGVDSNPYAVLAVADGWLVADAAGNDVLKVDRRGHIAVWHVFGNVTSGACGAPTQFDPTPAFPGCNFVPTALAADHWGNIYVGGLSGLRPGEAQVQVFNDDGRLQKTLGGFAAVTGLAVGHDGSLYVSQLFATGTQPGVPGVLTRIKDGHRKDIDVPLPAGVAVDSHNNVFVSAFSVMPDTGAGIPGIDSSGQIWRLRF